MNNLVAFGVFLYGLYLSKTGMDAGLSIEQMGQAITAIVGSLGYLGYTNKDHLQNLLVQKRSGRRKRVVFDEATSRKDFEAITYLRNRMVEANCSEGLETCAKLNSIIFNLQAVNVEEPKNA